MDENLFIANELNPERQEFLIAQNKLLQHVSNKDNYREQQYKGFNNVNITKDFTSQNQRRSYFFECVFEKSIFKHTGFTGSYFIKCKFENCDLDFAVLDNCYFYDCEFYFDEFKTILAASFCNSALILSSFTNCTLQACSLTGINCEKSNFENCILDDIIWENAKIIDCNFNKVKLQNLNIEYVYFDNNHLVDTNLPFASIPFSFKCINYLIKTTDIVKIDSETSENGINKEEYFELLPSLICFYKNTNNYFPLANILASTGKINDAFEVIKNSIPFLVKLHEYRTIKYISELMKYKDFSLSQKNEIYQIITSTIFKQQLFKEDYFLKADLYLFEIRNNLLNEIMNPRVSFEIYTNIEYKSYDKLQLLLDKIEYILNYYRNTETHYIEYRHNSPFQLLINIISSPETLVEIISVLYFSLAGIDKLYNKYLDTKQKKLDIEKTQLEIDKLKNNNNSDVKLSESDLNNIYKELQTNSIKIKKIYHNVNNVNVSNNYGDSFQNYSNN